MRDRRQKRMWGLGSDWGEEEEKNSTIIKAKDSFFNFFFSPKKSNRV